MENFLNFFENKETEWRLFNPNTQLFFWGRYTASTLKTYKDSKDFEQNELDNTNHLMQRDYVYSDLFIPLNSQNNAKIITNKK